MISSFAFISNFHNKKYVLEENETSELNLSIILYIKKMQPNDFYYTFKIWFIVHQLLLTLPFSNADVL